MKTKLDLDLVGKDGNAFFLLGYFRSEAKKAGWTSEEIEQTTAEAKSGDYDHLLQVLLSV